jgi:hypothetical protein
VLLCNSESLKYQMWVTFIRRHANCKHFILHLLLRVKYSSKWWKNLKSLWILGPIEFIQVLNFAVDQEVNMHHTYHIHDTWNPKGCCELIRTQDSRVNSSQEIKTHRSVVYVQHAKREA